MKRFRGRNMWKSTQVRVQRITRLNRWVKTWDGERCEVHVRQAGKVGFWAF